MTENAGEIVYKPCYWEFEGRSRGSEAWLEQLVEIKVRTVIGWKENQVKIGLRIARGFELRRASNWWGPLSEKVFELRGLELMRTSKWKGLRIESFYWEDLTLRRSSNWEVRVDTFALKGPHPEKVFESRGSCWQVRTERTLLWGIRVEKFTLTGLCWEDLALRRS